MATMWAWIGRRKQRAIIAMSMEHIDKIIETIDSLKEMLEHYDRGEYEKAMVSYENVFKKERKADDIKRKIIAELSKGVFHPIDREDLIRLTLTLDDIAAYVKAAGRRLVITEPMNIPKNIFNVMKTMTSKVKDATVLIKNAVMELYENPRKALDIANDIERIEEEVDDIRIMGLEETLKWCQTVDIVSCMTVKETIDSLENAADKCEDVADVIRSIALLTL
ncbi:MAG: DUF47 domain-containing protein [Thermoprotei archaeon]|nr:MAG: DUF47 domain-containing protein [Thermoprotei archaeon]